MNMTGYGGGVSSTNDIVFTAAGNHTFYALNGYTGQILWKQYDSSGDGALWSWGPPSITDGMVFLTSMGTSPPGRLEAYAVPYSTVENATFTESGLTSGALWNLTFDGSVFSSNTTSITIDNISSAVHYWSINAVANGTGVRFEPSPTNGTIPSQSMQFSFSIAFNKQFLVTFGVRPSKSGTTMPKNGRSFWYGSGAVVSISATPGQGFYFSRWASSTKSIVFSNKSSSTTTAIIGNTGKITAVFG